MRAICAVLLLASSGCSAFSGGDSERFFRATGCEKDPRSWAVEVESSDGRYRVLILTDVGITFHLDEPYFAKRFDSIDSIEYRRGELSITYTEGSTTYRDAVDGVDPVCGDAFQKKWAAVKSVRADQVAGEKGDAPRY